jgi:hypothetical protein
MLLRYGMLVVCYEMWIGEVGTCLKASDTQYEMKLVTPHFRAWRGTGSRSLLVLEGNQYLR